VLEYRVKSSDTIARPESPEPVELDDFVDVAVSAEAVDAIVCCFRSEVLEWLVPTTVWPVASGPVLASILAHAAEARRRAVNTAAARTFIGWSSRKRHSETRPAWRTSVRFSFVVLRPSLSAGLPFS
jgi:hypothetical protein